MIKKTINNVEGYKEIHNAGSAFDVSCRLPRYFEFKKLFRVPLFILR